MIRAYDTGSRSLVPVQQLPKSGWIHVLSPTAEDLERLEGDLLVPREFLRHACDVDELARIDHLDGVQLIVARVPWKRPSDVDVPYRTSALSLVVRQDLVVSIALNSDEIVEQLISSHAPMMWRPEQLFLQLLLRVAQAFLHHLREIDRAVDALEEQLKESQANREVLALLRYQKGLVHFSTGLSSNQIMLERLERHPRFLLDESTRDLLDEVSVEMRQAAEVAKVASDILGQMMDAFASIISNNLNIVMRVLTALTVVLAIPTLIASYYGMNVALPGAHSPDAFVGIVAVSMALGGVVIWLLIRQRWL